MEVVTSPEIQIRKATPFTYLTLSLPSGDSVCGYTTGFTSIQSVNGIQSVDFTIVYVTDNSLEPERTQILSSGQYLPRKRQIIKAGNYQAWNNSEFGYLGNNIRICSKTNTLKLFFPTADILEYHDPFTRTQQLLDQEFERTMPQLYHGFRKVYEFLVENGVAPSDIGVYGSLLAGIIGRNPKDIDIVLRGLRNQPIIRELAHKLHPKPTTFQFQNISNTALLAEQARIKNGSIVIPNGAGVYCDVKVVPNYDEGNANRVFCSDSLTFGDTIEFEGDIIEDRESLSYPGSYVIHTYHGPILVVSNCYEHIGSACEGDRVKCRGVEFTTDSGEKGIMLTKTQYEPDGDTHFIVI